MQNEPTSLKVMAFWSGQFNETYPNGRKGTIFLKENNGATQHLEITYKNPKLYPAKLESYHFIFFEQNLIVFDAILSDGSKGKFIVCVKDNFKFYANQDIREVLNDNFEKGYFLMMESDNILKIIEQFAGNLLAKQFNPLHNKTTYFEINQFPFHSEEYKINLDDPKEILNDFQ